MRTHTIVRWVAFAVAGSVLLTSCSLGDNGEANDGGKPVTIASVLGASDYGNGDEGARQKAIEEAVATCMIAEGWEYVPVTFPAANTDAVLAEEDEVARIKREGFGVAYSRLYPGDSSDPWAGFVDPNDAYVESLGNAAAEEYYGSLYGTPEEQAAIGTTEVDPETGNTTTIVSTNFLGCKGEAASGVWGDGVSRSPQFWDALQSYYTELEQRIAADPRMVKLNDDWSVCIKKSGFDYASVQDLRLQAVQEFQKRSDDILGPDFYKDPTAGWSDEKMREFAASATQKEIDALYNQTPELTADQRTMLEDVLSDEVALALAEHTCSTVLNAKTQDVSADVEAAYAREHEDELTALAVTPGDQDG